MQFHLPVNQTTYTFGIPVFKVRIHFFAVITTAGMRRVAGILFQASTIDAFVKFSQALFWHSIRSGETLTRKLRHVVEMELVGLPAPNAREFLVRRLSEDLPVMVVIPRFSNAARDILDFLNLPITSLGFVQMQ